MTTKKIGIIDYGFGNQASVLNAIRFLNYEAEIIKDSDISTNPFRVVCITFLSD